jgi:hypothetical protein
MKPEKLLTADNYLQLARTLFDHIKTQPPVVFFKACETDFVASNEDFYPMLLQAIRDLKEGKESLDPTITIFDLMKASGIKIDQSENDNENKRKLNFLEGEISIRLRQIEAVKKGLPAYIATDISFRNSFLTSVGYSVVEWKQRLIRQIEDWSLSEKQLLVLYEYCLVELNLILESKSHNSDDFAEKAFHNSISYVSNRILELKDSLSVNIAMQPNSNPEFTTHRQVLAIYHLLNHCKVNLSLVNKTDLARFSQFLTGKEANNPKIENTNIYKIWKGIYSKTEKGNAQDLRYIRDFFSKLGLMEICENIDKDING